MCRTRNLPVRTGQFRTGEIQFDSSLLANHPRVNKEVLSLKDLSNPGTVHLSFAWKGYSATFGRLLASNPERGVDPRAQPRNAIARETDRIPIVNTARGTVLVCLCFRFLFTASCYAQSPDGASEEAKTETLFAPRNAWGIFGEFSPNSSQIFLGVAQQRRLLMFGGEYAHRFHAGNVVTMDFLVQARPVILESDPALLGFRNVSTGKVEFPITPLRVSIIDHTHFVVGAGDVVVPFYTRQWNYAGGLNPFGIKMNFRPRHRLQPVVTGAGGFVISRRDIPVDHAAAFNFSFELGGGLEWFSQPRRSFRLDYRVHHISNADTATRNPGIDSGLFQLTYSFGK
jgi:hypothetical protein